MQIDVNKIDQPPKYQKKQPSSVSKAKAKSKHKHAYDKIVLLAYKRVGDLGRPDGIVFAEPHEYCSVCGKVGRDLWEFNFKTTYNTLDFTLEKYKEKYPNALIIKCTFNDLFKLKTIQEFQEAEKCIDRW